MAQGRSKYQFYQESMMGQRVAYTYPEFTKLAGSDPATSESIGFFEVLGAHGFIDLKDPNWKLILDLLDMTRKAKFATSEKTNEITKMAFMLPKGTSEVDFDEDTG